MVNAAGWEVGRSKEAGMKAGQVVSLERGIAHLCWWGWAVGFSVCRWVAGGGWEAGARLAGGNR